MADQQQAVQNTEIAEGNRRRRGRSWAILVVLLGLCALFYAITIVKLAHQ